MRWADYITALSRALARSDATEHSHRPALKALIESAARNIAVVNEPARIECGAPDLVVAQGSAAGSTTIG